MVPLQKHLAFIGLGVMGQSMAWNLLRRGYALSVFSRSKSRAAPLLEAGARWHDSAGSAARDADVVLTMVGFPQDVRQVYCGRDGILAMARAGAYLVDMTTSEPSLAKEIHRKAADRGLAALDAPVSGGDIGAREATLSIMVGGDRDDFHAVEPILSVMGRTIVYQGPPGSGQHTKMCNQITIASTMIGVMEALLYARHAGLDPDVVLQSIASGAAASWSLQNLQPRVIRGDYEPGFYVEHFLKDMRIALQEARGMGIRLPGLMLAEALYRKLFDQGGGRLGTQALYKVLDAGDPPSG